MPNVAFLALALAVRFLVQVAWWRVRGPSLPSVLLLFLLSFVALTVAALRLGVVNVALTDYVRLTMFYVSVILSYTIVCSLIDARSPTLSIVTYIADC